ncbi:MAG: 1,4-dihydroxy-2-naphthoate polyprenyltransferase [Candidatus Accumulibacter meliphilus]|jgi:1,4-dihydroxy-2-naphthoate octaprenyltransferase|uniref:1,4-dihydroxy-2-naphthoate octaprenyltransferase n=1 Tax=Candidatus Accumulibacter meliphilus TaxID=2211374 RepID=A0A369XP78_9PROT|nr:MAG: 1,4-dihydroxy-2-naphthoate polyprenyltransferase [Candidatus Accumulibacter meliphilus]
MLEPAVPPSPLGAWWLAIRPKTLTVSVAPLILGHAVAWAQTGELLWQPALVALLAALLIQIGTNLHNDVGDFERGSDTPDRLGPPRVTAMGWLPAVAVRRVAWLALALAFNFGIYLAYHGGWPIVVIGLASLLAAWAYTGGPWPIAYTPLGELFVVLFFGLAAVGGSYYLQTLSISPAALLAGAMLGLFAAAVITVNNYRDLATDARAGRRTLAVVVGRQATQWVYAAELLLPLLLLPCLALVMGRGLSLALPLLLLPPALRLLQRFRRVPAGPVFNQILASTARLQFVYALLLALAIVI